MIVLLTVGHVSVSVAGSCARVAADVGGGRRRAGHDGARGGQRQRDLRRAPHARQRLLALSRARRAPLQALLPQRRKRVSRIL